MAARRSLPLNFYCRSARLLLKKATFSRKSNLLADELRNLKKFSTLASSVIPSHPEYEEENGRKLAEDLEVCMDDVRERIEQLEEQLSLGPSTAGRRKSPTEDNFGEKSEKPKIWERFARKLREAAARSPCFSAKVHPVVQQPNIVSIKGSGRFSRQSDRESVRESESLPPAEIYLSTFDEASDSDEDEGSTGSRGCLASWSEYSKKLVLDGPRDRAPSSVGSEDTSKSQLMGSPGDELQDLQILLVELRDSVQGLRSRLEEEGKRWRGRVDGLERKLKVLKDDTERGFTRVKHQVQMELKKAVSEVSKDFQLARNDERKKSLSQKLDIMCETPFGEVVQESFRNQVNQFMAKTQTVLMHELENKLSDSISDLRGDLKNESHALEMGISKDVDNLRQEMVSRFESLLIDVELDRIGEQQQLSSLMRNKMGNMEGQKSLSGDLNKQLQALRADFRALSKEVCRLSEEQATGGSCLQKEMQGFKEEAMQERVDAEVMIKDCELEVKEAKHEMIELKGEQEQLKAELKQLKEHLTSERQHLSRCLDIDKAADKLRSDSDSLQLVERVQQFSKLYTNCLNDLQDRVSRLEAGQEMLTAFEQDKVKLEDNMAIVEKERVLAVEAASEAIATASKAKEMLEATLQSVLGNRNLNSVNGTKDKDKLQQPHLKNAVGRLNRRMRDVVSRLTGSSCARHKAGTKKLLVKGVKRALPLEETASEGFYGSILNIEGKMKVAAGILSKLNSRVQKLEDVQQDHARSLRQVETGNKSLQQAASLWLVRYEATTKLVMEVNARVILLESSAKQDPSEAPQLAADVVLHKDNSIASCQERLVFLEDRLEHIASVTYANLRLLDAKLDHVSIGTRSALDIATEAEDKCSSLAAELVRVFRLIISSRESSKKQQQKQQQQQQEQQQQPEVKKSEQLGCPERGPTSALEEPVKRINLRLGSIISKVPI